MSYLFKFTMINPLLIIHILSILSTIHGFVLTSSQSRQYRSITDQSLSIVRPQHLNVLQITKISNTSHRSRRTTKHKSNLAMCICVNCAHVVNCKAYHFVETKHEQPHMTVDPTFEPQDGSPTIHVNIRTIRNKDDREKEMERMWREHEAETRRALKLAEEQGKSTKDGDLVGEEVYDFSPVTTYEYDVVACKDYVHDDGCWVRNMPEEIKRANPNFIPS